ncbi:DUF2812 domain-containing protein [Tissierella sp. Yu-01]|uniref:DUF2812 domain-containing protein n=1 Tax=Tissierella sp. Yu-01 TaxID=3035694 RepID=UPI00240E6F4C|nr:DUF2812 domain-containing protein [Tissierella sp. Yu-01]WFA09267.1 DUF2812 domain-containing protein [Tissierella sp. Yu-01]
MIKKMRIFLDPIEGQEKWLNERVTEGLRLSRVGRFIYEFNKCEPNQFQYAVDYIGNKSNAQRKEYENFLDEVGITYFEKPLNLGQFSIGRIKYRPYANKGGKLATSRGMINREILILEKEYDGKTFDIYSSLEDKILALKERRKPHFYLLIFIFIMGLYINNIVIPPNYIYYLWVILGVIAILPMTRIIQLSLSIKSLSDKMKINE